MDKDGYPTDEEIERIKAWPYDDFMGLMHFIRDNCWWPNGNCGFKQTERKFRLATGGWSGNEEVVAALGETLMFNALCWQSSHRGGLHIYQIPKDDESVTRCQRKRDERTIEPACKDF
jgi:hypothetical protein